MADEQQTIEQVAAEQVATDPRLEQPKPAAEAPADPAIAAAPAAEAPEPEPTPEAQPKPKKSTEEVLKGRVGHLTKTLSTKDQELNAALARAEAAEALLSASRTVRPEGDPEPAPAPATQPAPGQKTYTEAELNAHVAQRAEADAFNRQANAMYDAGAKAYPDWKDAVDTLNAAGFMNKDLLDAAMATDDGAAAMHYLGSNLEEAERIAALPPIRKAAELVKIAAKANAPKPIAVSAAPAPITPVKGSPTPVVDLQKAADDTDMDGYAAARAAQGAIWARPRSKRA